MKTFRSFIREEEDHPAVKAFAAAAHEEWRKGFEASNGKGAERIKKNSDGTSGNINVPFHKLHPDWQRENLAAGRAAKEAVEKHPHDDEKAAEHVHNEWMKRNPKADYNAAQHVPYKDLPEEEKEKDRVHVRKMKSLLKSHISEVAEPTGDLKKACWKGYTAVGMKMKNGRKVPNCVPVKEAANAAQQAAIAIAMKKAGKKPKNEEVEQLDERGANKYKRSTESGAGLTRAGVMKYRRENPGSKLSTAVTKEPSKLKKGSRAWNRRKSFCARMSGMKGPMKDEKGRPTRKAMSLRRWHCEE